MKNSKCPYCKKELKDVEKHIERVHKDEIEHPFSLVRSETFSKIYITRTLTTFTEFDFRIITMNEKTRIEDGEVYIADIMACLTPTSAKELNQQLTNLIEKYEEENGRIPSRPQKSIYTKMEII
jgi:hypothetical protein